MNKKLKLIPILMLCLVLASCESNVETDAENNEEEIQYEEAENNLESTEEIISWALKKWQ